MEPPEHLSIKSIEIWKDIDRLASRKLNKSDYALIEIYCTELDTYDQAVKTIREEGITNDHNQVHPAVTIRNQAGNHIRQLSKQIAEFTRVEPVKNVNPKPIKNF